MKKGLLVASILVLIVLVGGCSLKTAPSTTTGSIETTSTTLGGSSSTAPGSSTTLETISTPSTTTSTAAVSQTIRYEQTDSRLTYSGSWKTTSTASASGGSFAFASASGSSVTIHFTGIDLAWFAKKSPAYGKAKVTVDGGSPVIVDLYSAGVLWQQKVWSTGILTNGTHTVKISWTGTKDATATSTSINIDAVDVTGTLD